MEGNPIVDDEQIFPVEDRSGIAYLHAILNIGLKSRLRVCHDYLHGCVSQYVYNDFFCC